MDLGIRDRKSIVCAADTDLGLACALALAAEGVELYVTAADAAADLAEHFPAHSDVQFLSCDITTAEGRDRILAACPDPDILVNHAPGPPTGDFRQWNRQDWIRTIDANRLAAIELIRATRDGMVERGFGRILNITSQSVKSPMQNLDLSNAARAGLTGFVAGVARERRDADVTINNVLPGLFETRPLANYIANTAARDGTEPAEVTAKLLGDNPLARLGRPDEFGATCAFLCSPLAGYINAQNILVDGGSYRGVL